MSNAFDMMARMSSRPSQQPIGLALSRTARAVSTAFERAMAEAGGSASTWQVLLLVRSGSGGDTQSRMAEALGITGATLTHHLGALERKGLVRRWREPDDRRAQQVALTPEGEALFERLRTVAQRHDRRLRANLTDEETATLRALLEQLRSGFEQRPEG